ncbi:GNAT family N-acetyltransferase [Streptomyces sp. Tu 3180]|uniref:GNAT family N-acetyltransferase n=1 Tax=Streptomyces sp. Tu 3180 TaxID=2682611 RepID=UPI00135B2DB7|nr:GNAT family N-acetyltransferase [Streptomyces sp. Tu 3180]KAF3470108.1 GNAT family N-acetyltransferase [Streptomyces sp. Tu 3180]
MRLLWEWLHPVIRVPYVPTIGPVHPDALGVALFGDVLRVAGTGAFLPYDKDQRWAATKDETVLLDHIEHTSARTLIPTLRNRGSGTLTVYVYGPATEEASGLAAKLAAGHHTSTARVVTFHAPEETPPAGTAVTRVQMKSFTHSRHEDQPGPIQAVAALSAPVRDTFAAFADRLTSDGFAFLHSQMQANSVGPVLAATDGGRIVGAIGPMETMPDHAGATRLLPQYFGVLPEHRGHGHGRTLWRAAMAWGTAHGADYQLLQTEIGGASDRLCQSEGLRSLGFVSVTKL